MKAILVINTSGNYGGAEKRVVSLFGHINRERNDYFLLINRTLYDQMSEKGILSPGERIVIIDIPFDKTKTGRASSTSVPAATPGHNPVRAYLGKVKYFLKTLYSQASFSKQLETILKNKNIKTVYTIWQSGIWGRKVFKRLAIKVIYGANSNLVWHLERDILNRFDSQYRILRDADHVDFLSAGLVEELKGLMPPEDFPENYSISPCSFINYDNFYPVYPKQNKVIFSGRLVKLKNPILFLEAVKIFNKSYPRNSEISFHILGTGPEEKAIKHFVSENGLNNVFFEGKVSKPEQYLQKSKIFISIQQTENYPSQALIEAMACENAVIASNVGETRKLVTDDEGELVQLDAKEIANAIIRLFSDEEVLVKKGRSARKKVMAEHTAERFKTYFYSITDDKQ
ncbi:MAG: glycosyltransferase family 4 protein [Chlorobi bacterium]|nr:glycosyltransferase family 4 protein [Chlorobiota bacterium]